MKPEPEPNFECDTCGKWVYRDDPSWSIQSWCSTTGRHSLLVRGGVG